MKWAQRRLVVLRNNLNLKLVFDVLQRFVEWNHVRFALGSSLV
jgi:hypothetical protein